MKLFRSLINKNGFSLIEIAIVFSVVCLMAAIALPNFAKINDSYNLGNSARLMASDIRSVQQTANKTESTAYNILFDTVYERYYLKNNLTPYKTVNMPSSVDLVSSNFTGNNLIFAISGRPFGGIGGTVTLQDRKTGKLKYIIIDTIGRVRVSNTP